MSEKTSATATPEKISHRGGEGKRRDPWASPRPATVNPFLALQHNIGNQAMLRLLAAGAVQAKLRISQPSDADELEADRVADRVAASPEPPAIHRKCNCEGGGASCPACEEEEVEQAKGIHRKASSSSGGNETVPSDFLKSIGPGQPLDSSTRGFMESRFGRDFGGVRIHTGDQASESARFIQARAFAAGSHVVFDAGQYSPNSLSGKRLLAHELTHVAQQSRTGKSNVVHRAPPPQWVMPQPIIPGTYSQVKTARLNGQGPFTKEVLSEIAGTWTPKSAYGGPDVAQRAVDLLEASDTFVQVANELDNFHLKKDSPKFQVLLGFMGTKFAPAGTALQFRSSEPVEVYPDENVIIIDYTSSVDLFGPKEQQIVQFASTIIHESRHALDHIKKITRGGLQGHLEEEQRTRKAEIKGLQEIKSGTTDKAAQPEIDKRIAQIQQGGLTNREIAEDFVSGGEGTYLESFFLDSAIDDLTARKAQLEEKLKKANSPIPGTLTPITTVAMPDLENYDLSGVITTLFYSLTPHLPEWAVTPGHTPSKGEVDFLLKFQAMNLNLKQLTDFRAPRLSDDYRYVFLYLALVKAYRIKAKIAQAWQDFRDDPDPNKKKSDVLEKNARDFLGIPRAYSGVRG